MVMMMIQIVGTSKNFKGKKRCLEIGRGIGGVRSSGSESDPEEESMNNARRPPCGGGAARSSIIQSFTPATPPQTPGSKRRKGIPHRAPMSGLQLNRIVEH